MRSLMKACVAAVALASSSLAAMAANVSEVEGPVQISRSGGPFKAITGPEICNAGDVVRAQKDGSARVFNQNGVIQVATVGKPVTCVARPGPAGTTPATASTGAVVGGAAAVAIGVGGIIALSKKNSSSP
jgi:opacity protein-like surface antigen